MTKYDLCVPCLLGLEGPIADELRRLKLENVHSENEDNLIARLGRVVSCIQAGAVVEEAQVQTDLP